MTKIAAPMPTWAQTSVKTTIPITPTTRNPSATATHLSTTPVTVRRVYGAAASECNRRQSSPGSSSAPGPSRRAPALPVVCFRCLVAYYLVERLADGRRLIATHETREGAESHRSVLIMQGRHRADAVFVLEDQPEGEQAEVEKAREE